MAFNRDRNSRGGGGFRPRFNDRGGRGPVEMHDAVCDNCGKNCQVPFRPTSGKPIYCSECFEAKGGGARREERPFSRPEQPRFREQPNYQQQFDALNNKLDNILRILETAVTEAEEVVEVVEPSVEEQPQEETAPKIEKKKRVSKKAGLSS